MVVPQIRWLDQIGGPEEEQTEGVTVSSGQERLFATGFTFGTFGDNSNTPGSGFDVWVADYDLGGNLQDSVQLNSEAEGAVPDDFARALTFDASAGGDGLLYVVGETFGDITNNPDRAINTGSSDGFIAVYQPTENGLGGDPISTFQFDIGDNGRRDFVSDVTLDSEGNVYVVGNTQQGNNGFDAYVAKFTPETLRNFDTTTPGEEQAEWIEVFSTSGRDEAEAVGISDGELFVTGSTTGNIDADGEETNDSNLWLARITDLDNASGSSITVNELESPGEDEAFDLALSGGDIYLTGSTRGFLDSQDNPANDPDGNLGRRDAWVAKFDGETFSETATPNWIEQFGSGSDDFARGITAFSTVNEGRVEETTISVTGYTDGNLNGASNQGSLDAWVVELIDDRAEDAVSLPNQAPSLTEAPVFGEGGIVLDTIVSRSLSSGEVVGTANAIDRQQDEITYELLSGGSNLNINAETGQLRLTNPDLDDSLEFVVQARDDAQPRNTNQVNVILPVDQNAPPVISDSTFNDVPVTEGSLGGVVANFADPDNDNNFNFSIVGGNTDVNNAPIVSDQTFILDEFDDNSAIGTVNAGDPEGESLTFTIASGLQGGVFSETTLNADQTEIIFETGQEDEKEVTFALDANSGEISLANLSNAVSIEELTELDNNFQLTIQADDGSKTNTGNIEIDIVDNPPEFSQEEGFSLDVVDVGTTNNGDSVGEISASDPGGETVTYEITNGNGVDAFDIDTIDTESGEIGEITVENVNELATSFTLTVAASDGRNVTETEVIIPVEVSPTNNAPVISDSTFNVDFTAEGDVPDEIGSLNVGDPENDSLSFTITDGDTTGIFDITDEGLLTVEDDSLIEAGETFNLVVRVDDGNATDTGSVTINFADKPPEFDESGFSFDRIDPATVENGQDLGSVNANDPEGTAVSYRIVAGNEGNPFAIDSDSGEITLNDRDELSGSAELIVEARDENENISEAPVIIPVDEKSFSINNEGQVTLTSTENVASGDEVNLTVEVDDGVDTDEGELTLNFVDKPPLVSNQTFLLSEFSNGTSIGTVNAADPEGNPLTFTITEGTQESDFTEISINDEQTEITFETDNEEAEEAITFAINENTGEITLASEAVSIGDLQENNFQLTIEANDGGEVNTGEIEIAIIDQPPEFTQEQGFSFEAVNAENVENGDVIGSVSASDPEGEPINYAITNGNDSDTFTINDSGEVVVSDSEQLNTSFTLTVAADDNRNTTETQVVIPVDADTDANESPIISNSTFSVDLVEAEEVPDEIGTLNFGDPENDSLSFTITDTDDDPTGIFDITDEGLLTVENDSLIEAGETFNLVVQVDDGNTTDTGEITINFPDQPPEFTETGFSFNPIDAETANNGDFVGTVEATDPEETAISYSIVEGNEDDVFVIDDSGEITLDNRNALTGSTELVVEAQDANNTAQVPVIIPVDETKLVLSNEDQVFERQGGFVFDTLRPETATDGESVGTVEATDPNGESLTFAIVDGNDPDENDTNAFEIDPDSGEISLLDADELTQNYELTVEANNGDETTRTAVIIPVNTANDAPIIDETDFVSENVGTGGIVGIVNAVDPDGDDLEFELSGAGDQLAIDEDGVVTITSDADFTLGDSIDFEVTATDEVGEADTAEISLNFRDLVELDPETGTQIIGSEDADFARDITSDRGGNLFIGGETAGVLSSAEPPIIRDGFVNGDTITLRYNKPLDASAGPARSDFDVVVDTVINDQVVGSPEISVSNVDIDGQSVILSLTQEVTQDDLVGVSYEDPSDFDDENAIQDRFGNDAADLSLQVVNLTGTGEDIPELPEEENEEENAGALDIWLSRLGDNDPSPAAGTTESAEPPQPTQSVFTDIDEVTAQTPIFQNTSFNFDVNYSAIDAEGNSAADLSGLGLRMHFDSDVLDLEDIDLEEDARTPDTQPVNLPNDIQEDTNNFDGDGSTDSFVLLSWSDVNEAWPGDSQLERPLFNATFKTERDFAGDVDSTINFTASSTADGFSFASSDPVIEPDKYTYDVDDNGDVDALTDGLQILNFLFDNNNRAIDSAIASNANRETEEVTDFLNLGGNSSAFDVDGNGNEDALTDGILIVRYMFGFRGEALINDAIADNAERTTPGDIEGYIQDFLPS